MDLTKLLSNKFSLNSEEQYEKSRADSLVGKRSDSMQRSNSDFTADLQQKGLRELTANLFFDHKLKEKASIIRTPVAFKRYKFHQKYLNTVNGVCLFIYYFLTPLAQAPAWCVKYYADTGQYYSGWTYICSGITTSEGLIPCSQRPRLAPILISTTDTLCLFYFLFHMWYKRLWRIQNRNHNFRFICMIVIFIISVADIFVSDRRQTPPFIQNLLRPSVILVTLSQARNHLKNVLLLFYDSALLISLIFIFVGFYSFTGFFLFKNTFEGYTYFQTPSIALYEMFICLTTSNFPNVMLPAYNADRWYCLYWIFFMCFGMYFLQNLLLASIFENYKLRVLKTAEDRLISRDELIESFFEVFDEDKNGYLDLMELKRFFSFLLDLDFRKPEHKITFRKAMAIIDPKGTHRVQKPEIVALF